MVKAFPCQLVSLQEVYDLSFQLALTIRDSNYKPDVVVAVARGGFPPARFLCDFLGVSAMTSVKVEHYRPGGQAQQRAVVRYPLSGDVSGQRVLLADDVNDSGDTLAAARDHLKAADPAEVRTAVLHEKAGTSTGADYWVEYVREWRWIIYPWAVTEDVGSFLQGMEPPPRDHADAARRLAQDYGIDIDQAWLEKLFQLVEVEAPGH